MKWRVARDLADADELMQIADCFHDWCMEDFECDTPARAVGQDDYAVIQSGSHI